LNDDDETIHIYWQPACFWNCRKEKAAGQELVAWWAVTSMSSEITYILDCWSVGWFVGGGTKWWQSVRERTNKSFALDETETTYYQID